jgi:hypothetical protein
MMVEAPSSAPTQLGDDLARALVRRGVDRAVGHASGRRRGASAKAPISVLSAGLPTNTGPPASHYRPIAT